MKSSFVTFPSVRSIRIALIALTAGAMATLSGCSLTGTATDGGTPNSATISGHVHGGQPPINNATVNLYAAGTTGYGSAGTLLATTTTDSTGYFSFTPGTANPGPGITSTWQCPTSNPDPQIYIIASGGNSSGTGATTSNSAIAFLAALGPCSGISSSTNLVINEITTAATVYALAQYINPGSSAGGESIGTKGTNITTSGATPQGAVGLNNAVASIVNLANVSYGTAVTSNTYTGTATTVAAVPATSTPAVTVTATPNTAKLTSVADILAACINTTSSSSSACADLFASAVPPPVASVTSQPSNSFGTAVDTIQAAYYLAVNPTNSSSTAFPAGSCNNSSTTTSRTACLFGLLGTSPQFQPDISATPNDWTIGVTYSSTSSCPGTGAGLFINGPYQSAVDANGNFWFINAAAPAGTAQASAFGEISPIGMPLFCGGAGGTAFTTGRGITIDPAGNVWASFGNKAKLEYVASGGTAQTSCATPSAPYGIVSDGNGNIFYSPGTPSSSGATAYVFPSGSTSLASCNATSTTEWIASGASPASSSSTPFIAADGLGRIWFGQEANSAQAQIAYPVSAPITAYSVAIGTPNTVQFTAANSFSTGEVVTVTGLTTTEGLILDHQNYTITGASSTNFTAATTAAPIVSTTDVGTAFIAVPSSSTTYATDTAFSVSTSTYGIAIDNNNYGYFGTSCCATAAPNEEFNKVTAPATTTAPTKSTSGIYLAGSTGTRSLAVDGAGNIWFGMQYPEVGAITATAGTASTDIYGVGEFYTAGSTFTALSPSGSTPATCSTSNTTPGPECPVGGGFQDPNFLSSIGIAVDPSGNVWVPNTGGQVSTGSGTSSYYYFGTSITELVGAAVPVVTPISLGLKNGSQGTKP